MFLRPHHFQQYDLYVESREIGYLSAIEHYGWGLVRLDLQEESLNNFVLGVRSLRAVLPDGTLIDVPGNARLPSRPIDRKASQTARHLDVSVGVRAQDDRGPLAHIEGTNAGQARFVALSDEVYDLDAGRDPTPIERLEYDLHFFLGDEPTHGHATLPLVRLAFTGDPSRPVEPARDFAPPCLALSASPMLHEAARAVAERIATVLRDVAEFRGSDEVNKVVFYQSLAGRLPVLKDMVRDGKIHPRRAYQELARIAGTLFFKETTGRSIDEIPDYDHHEPAPVFQRLRVLIHELSEPGFRRQYMRVPMERSGDQFRAGLPSEAKGPGVRLYLEVLAQDSVGSIRTIVPKARISGPARMQTLTNYNLPGIATEPQPGPPPALPPGQTGTFFRLKIEDGTEWGTQVVPAGELATLLLGAPQDLKLNLIVVLPGA